MKRLWFSAAFILIVIVLCVVEQTMIYDDCGEIIERIDAAIQTNDVDEKKAYCDEVEEMWVKFEEKASYVMDHAILHSAEISVGTLKDLNELNIEDANEALIEAKSEIKQVYDHSKISLSNIL